MASPIIIHFTSASAYAGQKTLFLHSELLRAKRTGSDDDAVERGIDKVTNIFLSNGYPRRIIKRAIFKAKHTDQMNKNQTKEHSEPKTLHSFLYPSSMTISPAKSTLKLAPRDFLSESLGKGDKQSRVCSFSRRLPQQTCPSGSRTCNACEAGVEGKCTTKNVVYEIKCTLCQDTNYVGENEKAQYAYASMNTSAMQKAKLGTHRSETTCTIVTLTPT